LYYIYFKLKEYGGGGSEDIFNSEMLQQLYEIIYFDTQVNQKFKPLLKQYI
jgi:hypothetical protein